MTKMTQKNAIAFVIEQFGAQMPEDVLGKVKEVQNSLNRKSQAKGERKPTKTQIANEGFKAVIVEAMSAEPDWWFTITEMQKSFGFGEELSNQRISALVRQLKEQGIVTRDVKEGKAVFQIVTAQ